MNFLNADYGFKELCFLYMYPLYAWKSGLVRKHKIECNLYGVSQVHRSAPIESVAMSKQGLTVMFSKCPAT